MGLAAKKTEAPAWRPPARVERWGDWVGPLQEIRTPVEGNAPWIIVQQETRDDLSRMRLWLVSAIHPNHEWDGTLPFTTNALGFAVPCIRSWSLEDRDREIANLLRIFALPMSGPKRDYTCGSCRLTERDGNTNRPAGKLCVYCRK